MTTYYTLTQIEDLHARRIARGAGYAPSLAETIDAANAGQLFDVDTQSAGEDCLAIGESADDVLSEVAAHHNPEAWGAHADGGAAYARSLRWTAERIGVAHACAVCEGDASGNRTATTSLRAALVHGGWYASPADRAATHEGDIHVCSASCGDRFRSLYPSAAAWRAARPS